VVKLSRGFIESTLELGLFPGCGIGVEDAFGNGLINNADSLAQAIAGALIALFQSRPESFDGRFHAGFDRLIALGTDAGQLYPFDG
jgi:hypothetical protein